MYDSDETTILQTLCGSDVPSDIHSSSNTMKIVFISDDYDVVGTTGFKAQLIFSGEGKLTIIYIFNIHKIQMNVNYIISFAIKSKFELR